nr:polymer-forming cytoskeletal protein [Halapricum desulfuricans]
MLFRSDPLEELAIPDGTTVEEHDLVTDGDVLVGGQSTVEFGVRGRNVIAGERVRFGGHIEAEGDCRLDMWCDVADNVLVGEDAYLGERVHVGGQLKVAGDIDIGDDVDIEEGFEANGWIVIRNPMPTIVFLFVYLGQLLRIGEQEAAEDALSELLDGDHDEEPVVIPRGATVGDDAWRVSTPARVGDDCRIHGNVRAESVTVGRDNVLFGSLRGKDDIVVGRGSEIKGNVTTRNGDLAVGPGVKIWGDVAAENVRLHENATVDGTIRAGGEIELHTADVLDDPDEDAETMAEMAAEMEAASTPVAEDDGPVEDASAVDEPDEEKPGDDDPAEAPDDSAATELSEPAADGDHPDPAT